MCGCLQRRRRSRETSDVLIVSVEQATNMLKKRRFRRREKREDSGTWSVSSQKGVSFREHTAIEQPSGGMVICCQSTIGRIRYLQ